MPDTIIRRASTADSKAIADLTRELGYESSPESASARLARLDTPENAVFVAEVEGAVVGWIHVAEVTSIENDPYAEIRGLVVSNMRRGGGIGGRLVAAAEEWARNRALKKMRVRSNVVRTEARRFYEVRGYAVTKSQNVFDKRLG